MLICVCGLHPTPSIKYSFYYVLVFMRRIHRKTQDVIFMRLFAPHNDARSSTCVMSFCDKSFDLYAEILLHQSCSAIYNFIHIHFFVVSRIHFIIISLLCERSEELGAKSLGK
jgi:hypothetical protein